MSTRIVELFGYSPDDESQAAYSARNTSLCPYINKNCQKTLSDRTVSGVCTLKPSSGPEVICCPNRLYADSYKILGDVASIAFGQGSVLVRGAEARTKSVGLNQFRVAVFGKHWGGELRLPNRSKSGGYFVDWILAKIDASGEIESFVAVEVQSIDTTGNYRTEREAHMARKQFEGTSTAGFNWENVNKRILPQLIYKGHVLRREQLCSKGMFFVCPTAVYQKIKNRLGDELLRYNLQSGSLTFLWYEARGGSTNGNVRELVQQGVFTTTVEQVAHAFTSPTNLPDQNVYEKAIRAAI
jgi:hypothetical protein